MEKGRNDRRNKRWDVYLDSLVAYFTLSRDFHEDQDEFTVLVINVYRQHYILLAQPRLGYRWDTEMFPTSNNKVSSIFSRSSYLLHKEFWEYSLRSKKHFKTYFDYLAEPAI